MAAIVGEENRTDELPAAKNQAKHSDVVPETSKTSGGNDVASVDAHDFGAGAGRENGREDDVKEKQVVEKQEGELKEKKNTSENQKSPIEKQADAEVDGASDLDASHSSADSSASPSSKKRRRHSSRPHFNLKQITMLETQFRQHRYISISQRAHLAKTLELTEQQVNNWFQNRRQRERKRDKTRSPERFMHDAQSNVPNPIGPPDSPSQSAYPPQPLITPGVVDPRLLPYVSPFALPAASQGHQSLALLPPPLSSYPALSSSAPLPSYAPLPAYAPLPSYLPIPPSLPLPSSLPLSSYSPLSSSVPLPSSAPQSSHLLETGHYPVVLPRTHPDPYHVPFSQH